MVDTAHEKPPQTPFAYRIKSGEGGDVVVHTVYEEGGQFVFEREGKKVASSTLQELIRLEPSLHLIGSDEGITIDSPFLKDYEIAALVQPEGPDVADFTVNGAVWSWSSEVIGRDPCPVISEGPHDETAWWAQTHWANLHTEGAFIFGIEASVTIDKLGSYYTAYDGESGESQDVWVEEPDYPWSWLFFDQGVYKNDQWVDAPDLDSLDDDAISRIMVTRPGAYMKNHVIWINERLWEWKSEDRMQRKVPPRTHADSSSPEATVAALPPLREILIGRSDDWVCLSTADRPGGTEIESQPVTAASPDKSTGAGKPSDRFVVILPPTPEGESVDLVLYEQMLEAVWKWPRSGCGDKQPPYALVRFDDGSVAHGCVVRDEEGARKIAEAFGSPALYRIVGERIEITGTDGSPRESIAVHVDSCDPPVDPAFDVEILGWQKDYARDMRLQHLHTLRSLLEDARKEASATDRASKDVLDRIAILETAIREKEGQEPRIVIGRGGWFLYDDPELAGEIRLQVSLGKGDVRVDSLHLRYVPIEAGILSKLPFARIVDRIRLSQSFQSGAPPADKEADRRVRELDNYLVSYSGEELVPVPLADELSDLSGLLQKYPTGARRPDEFYWLVIRICSLLSLRSDKPAAELAKHLSLPESRVRAWVREARRRGVDNTFDRPQTP